MIALSSLSEDTGVQYRIFFDKATMEIPLSSWVALSEEIKEKALDKSTEDISGDRPVLLTRQQIRQIRRIRGMDRYWNYML